MKNEKDMTDEEYLAAVRAGKIKVKEKDVIMGDNSNTHKDDEVII